MKIQETIAMAAEFAALWRQEQALKDTRRALGKKLMAALKRTRQTAVMVGADEAVAIMGDAKKCPTKADLVKGFGEAAAERFWKRLEAKVCQYLTVIKATSVAR